MIVSEEERERRLQICAACELSNIEKVPVLGNRLICGNLLVETKETCGCILPAKARFKNSKCKIGKWEIKPTE